MKLRIQHHIKATNSRQEARTGIITLPEDEQVIYCLLQYMYGVERDTWIVRTSDEEHDIMWLFEVAIAADKASQLLLPQIHRGTDNVKYGLAGCQTLCHEQILHAIETTSMDGGAVVRLAKWFYEPSRRHITPSAILRSIVAEAAHMIQCTMRDDGDEGWNELVKHPELLRDVVLQLAKTSAKTFNPGEDLTAEYLKDSKPKLAKA